jgi:hypothetical protein
MLVQDFFMSAAQAPVCAVALVTRRNEHATPADTIFSI